MQVRDQFVEFGVPALDVGLAGLLLVGNSTLVRFTLSEHDSGTELTVVETGFDTLDRDVADQMRAREGNVQGWHAELDELVAYLHGVKA